MSQNIPVTTKRGTRYENVEGVRTLDSGALELKVRTPAGKLRYLKNREVHTGEMHKVYAGLVARYRAERKEREGA
jgi:hypothetical protein